MKNYFLIFLSFSMLFSGFANADKATIAGIHDEYVYLKVAALPDNKHRYFVEILKKAINAAGYKPKITLIRNLDYQQITKMMDANRLSLRWLIPTAERNEKYVPIEVDIYDGMIGKRVLYIAKNKQAIYSKLNSIEDFRRAKLTAGFGKGWYDVRVWQHNKLPLIEVDREWRRIYGMIRSKHHPIDYITRSIIEVGSEYPDLKNHLDIEKHLLFHYERPYYFYLTKRRALYHDLLKQGLEQIKASGEMESIIDKFWGESLKELDLKNRHVIHLDSPSDVD